MGGVDEIAITGVAQQRAGAHAVDADGARFERLWTAHYAAVHAHAARRVGPRADEVCAEVFLVAWRRFGEIPRDALPWLLAASRNVIGTTWRGDARRARLQDRLEGSPALAGAPDHEALDPVLDNALAQLGERDRELLLLVYWEGLTPSRAAKALDLAPAAARTRLWRAHGRLRAVLSGQEEHDA